MPGRQSFALWASFAGVAALSLSLRASPGRAQFAIAPVEFSGSVTLDEVDSSVRSHLERIRQYVADNQWDEAIETLRQVMENHGQRLIAIAPNRYITLSEYCQVQIASLPSEALALYRQRVESLAERWYRDGIARRDADGLSELVDKLFCSSWGDDALFALGEMQLEAGRYALARRLWERLIEVPPNHIPAERFEPLRQRADIPADDAALLDQWYVVDPAATIRYYDLREDRPLDDGARAALVAAWKRARWPFTRLAYPETTLDLAAVRARLVLASILEGALDRARDELAALVQLHPAAQGRLAGREVKYADHLAAILADAENWPAPKPTADWLTFAGSADRNKRARDNLDLGAAAWDPIALGEPLAADSANSRAYSMRRIGEDAQRLLSYHPLVVGKLLLFNTQSQIFAFDVRSGKPAWPGGDANRPPGEVHNDGGPTGAMRASRVGVPRFTMTVHDNRLYARMGTQVTSRPMEFGDRATGSLVCIDLAGQGKLVWNLGPTERAEEAGWAFEGSPVVEGASVFIAMRKSDVRSQAYVACFDAETGQRRWRTMICAAETPGGGQAEEVSHNLLTLAQGMLYYNTNLGAIAAIEPRDGRLQWVTRYERARKVRPDGQDRRAAHFYRDLNPCVYDRGLVFAAPSDSEAIVALDAGTGELVWQSHLPEDVVHLLGVGHGNLLASGDRLWWIDARRGKIVHRWPDASPLGYGRGLLSGDQVLWPTADALYVLPQDPHGAGTPLVDPISLSEGRGSGGGNLLITDGLLLIATPERLFAFHQRGREPAAGPVRVAGGQPAVDPSAP